MTKRYDHLKAALFILKQGDPQTARFVDGVEFYCSGHGAASLKSREVLDFWGLEDGDTVALVYKDFGPPDFYQEDELIVRISDIAINYKSIKKTADELFADVHFAGDFEWLLGTGDD